MCPRGSACCTVLCSSSLLHGVVQYSECRTMCSTMCSTVHVSVVYLRVAAVVHFMFAILIITKGHSLRRACLQPAISNIPLHYHVSQMLKCTSRGPHGHMSDNHSVMYEVHCVCSTVVHAARQPTATAERYLRYLRAVFALCNQQALRFLASASPLIPGIN